MRFGFIVSLGLLSMVSGCMALSDMDSAYMRKVNGPQPQPASPAPRTSGSATPTPTATTASASSPKGGPQQDFESRRAATEKQIKAALALDGSSSALARAKQLAQTCRGHGGDDGDGAHVWVDGFSQPSPDHLGAMAGCAAGVLDSAVAQLKLNGIRVAERYLVTAEGMAQKADDESKLLADRKKQMADEQAALDTAISECSANKSCKTKCDGGDAFACEGVSQQLGKAGKLTEAKTFADQACEKMVMTACADAVTLAAAIRDRNIKIDSDWQDFLEIGDDVAKKSFYATNFAKMAVTPYQQSQLVRMKVINQAFIEERFCPKKKSFVSFAGAPEFQKRAAEHCKDSPPSASGISGTPVTLDTQCQTAYATPCP